MTNEIELRKAQVEKAAATLLAASEATRQAGQNYKDLLMQDELTRLGFKVRAFNYFAAAIAYEVSRGNFSFKIKRDIILNQWSLPPVDALNKTSQLGLARFMYSDNALIADITDWLENAGYDVCFEEDYMTISWNKKNN